MEREEIMAACVCQEDWPEGSVIIEICQEFVEDNIATWCSRCEHDLECHYNADVLDPRR